MAITAQEKKRLKGLAHHLSPVAQVGGQGMSEAFIASVNDALTARELIKVKVGSTNKKEDAKAIAAKLNAELVNLIGFSAILYRFNKELEEHVLDNNEEN